MTKYGRRKCTGLRLRSMHKLVMWHIWQKVWQKQNLKSYCKLICFANIFNFWWPPCVIKMLIYFSKKQVLPEFWQNWAWEHLRTLHIWARTPVWPYCSKKISINYCKPTLHAIFTTLIGSPHNILQKNNFFLQLNNFYSIIVDAWNKFASENKHLTLPQNGSNILTLFYVDVRRDDYIRDICSLGS